MPQLDLIQDLIEAICAADDTAAEAAAQACVGRTDLLPALRPLLTDIDVDRRWWGVRTVALIGGAEAASLAEERLGDANEATRCAAALALGQLRSVTGIPALAARLADESGWVRDSAADALAMLGQAALPALIEALADARDPIRVRAAGALRKTILTALSGLTLNEFPPPFLPALTALYGALNDPNRLVRQHAYEALDRLGLFDQVYFAP